MRNLMKNTASLLALIICITTYGQSNYFTYKTDSLGKELSFPVFYCNQDSLSAKKINQFLQISELEILKGYETKNIFEKVNKNTGGIYGGKVEISFETSNNNEKLLSISFNEASCGMTCGYWTSYYNFNSKNGDLIQLKDLFNEQNFETLNKYIKNKRIQEYRKEIMKLDTTENEGLLEVIRLIEKDDLTTYYIENNTLYIDGNNLLNKSEKFLDLNMITKFSISEFEMYLNEYGKCVFYKSNESIKKFRSSSLPQIYKGTIAGEKILLVLNSGYQNLYIGEYVYLKYGHGIYIEGKLEDGILTMTESNEKESEAGQLKIKFEGFKLSGTWTNKENTKTYKINAERN